MHLWPYLTSWQDGFTRLSFNSVNRFPLASKSSSIGACASASHRFSLQVMFPWYQRRAGQTNAASKLWSEAHAQHGTKARCFNKSLRCAMGECSNRAAVMSKWWRDLHRYLMPCNGVSRWIDHVFYLSKAYTLLWAIPGSWCQCSTLPMAHVVPLHHQTCHTTRLYRISCPAQESRGVGCLPIPIARGVRAQQDSA